MRNRPPPTKRETMSGTELAEHRKNMQRIGLRKRTRISDPVVWDAERILNYNKSLEAETLAEIRPVTVAYSDKVTTE